MFSVKDSIGRGLCRLSTLPVISFLITIARVALRSPRKVCDEHQAASRAQARVHYCNDARPLVL